MVPKSGTDEIPFYWMIRHPRKNPFCIPFLIINQAIETHLRRSSRVRSSSKGFFKGKMEGSAGAGHSLAPTGCSKPNAPLQSPPSGLEVHDSAQPNPRAQAGALGLNGAESAEASIPGVRIWGPVPKAHAAGAHARTSARPRAAASASRAPSKAVRSVRFAV